MDILNYKLDTTKELLTSRIGLLATAHTINTIFKNKRYKYGKIISF
ncbi:hypothetical protein [uncultured Gammaproteobacteria bacterium]|nr:hypothetical protein [uncultured Gammaproteobacteria bacterium]